MKLLDNGKDTVTVDFGSAGKLTINVNAYPDDVQQYGKIRGFRKYFSDQGAGFKGTQAELLKKCESAHERLQAGDFRSGGDRGVSADELMDIFAKLAPEADPEAIGERVRAIHPDYATNEKDKTKRQRKVREIVNAHKALQF